MPNLSATGAENGVAPGRAAQDTHQKTWQESFHAEAEKRRDLEDQVDGLQRDLDDVSNATAKIKHLTVKVANASTIVAERLDQRLVMYFFEEATEDIGSFRCMAKGPEVVHTRQSSSSCIEHRPSGVR